MSAFCEAHGGRKRIRFGMLARHVLSLDSAIEWVALEEAGREPRWAWRDPESGEVCAGSAKGNAEVVDPLLFMLADGFDDLHGEGRLDNPHHLLFVVLAYADMVQIVGRLGRDARVSVTLAPRIDPYALGTKLASVLDRCTQPPVVC